MRQDRDPQASQSGGDLAGPGGMTGLEPQLATAGNYRRFARQEATGRSPEYEALALGVAGDDVLLGYLGSLPAQKRQPNLLFAAARLVLGAVPDHAGLRRLVLEDEDRLRQVMLERRAQTNEPCRCATLLPALCALPEPLALVEVGALAGLTLLVDWYSYDYDGKRLYGGDGAAPVLACHVEGPLGLRERVHGVSTSTRQSAALVQSATASASALKVLRSTSPRQLSHPPSRAMRCVNLTWEPSREPGDHTAWIVSLRSRFRLAAALTQASTSLRSVASAANTLLLILRTLLSF